MRERRSWRGRAVFDGSERERKETTRVSVLAVYTNIIQSIF